ncbi:bifunctional folylpolyglutamate synthase/dihydrofolate synthase [Colwellia sp. 20A7]|uniref:bifunctional folylpolyglutamate synthase/dihydrofolate synthase n=1 Tax=Colwellia sp. 20A7 TaxID=2689569 RepID=UPI00135ADB5B|nr:Mur ligase family protein [Colwellia sp. 20A7]
MLKQNESHSKDFTSLNEWLCYLETIHSTEIDLGLARISQVARKLNIDFSFACVITVAGTNGKGTTCAFLENALLGEEVTSQKVDDTASESDNSKENTRLQTVAVYSSPHIEKFNERLRINKSDIDDQSLITAFEEIELARDEISLSYYEYTTLAAFLVLMKVKPDVIILEVGLGGRLDATNIIDADVAVITTIDLDHQAFLGNDRETIGFEKAGIMRGDQHIIIGDPNVPQSVLDYAKRINETTNEVSLQLALGKVKVRNKDFFIANDNKSNNPAEPSWQLQFIEVDKNNQKTQCYLNNLIATHIPQDNVVTALMVLKQLGVQLTTQKVNRLISNTQVAGRTELFKGKDHQADKLEHNDLLDTTFTQQCDVMLDVGHNPHAGRYLAEKIAQFKAQNQYQRIIAVVAMLADKDIANTLSPFNSAVDEWYVAPLMVPRAATSELMVKELSHFTNSINCFDNITQAFKMANLKSESNDLILVFGSFYTVAEIRQLLI